MKKSIFVAALVAAVSFAFIACEGNGPDSPINPADYVGTKWRIDSTHIKGKLDMQTDKFIDVKTDKQVVFNGTDTTEYAINGNTLIIGKDAASATNLTIKQATKDFAELELIEDTKTKVLYLSRIPESKGENLSVTEENIVGTWKHQYNYKSKLHDGKVVETFIYTRPGVEIWTFYADGTLKVENIVAAAIKDPEYQINTGWWHVMSDRKIAYGFESKPNNWTDENLKLYTQNVATLTYNSIYFGTEEDPLELYGVDLGGRIYYYTYLTKIKIQIITSNI